ncbi:MAG: hypothetical protein ACD_75C00490G0001, partial [uncultured bacterium]
MKKWKAIGLIAVMIGALTMTNTPVSAKDLLLETKWDKTFPKSEKVDHQKVTFKNRYGITLAADLYLPKNRDGKRLTA